MTFLGPAGLSFPDPDAARFVVRSLQRICAGPVGHEGCDAALDELEAMPPDRRRACEHELLTVLNAWGLIISSYLGQTLPEYLAGLGRMIPRHTQN